MSQSRKQDSNEEFELIQRQEALAATLRPIAEAFVDLTFANHPAVREVGVKNSKFFSVAKGVLKETLSDEKKGSKK